MYRTLFTILIFYVATICCFGQSSNSWNYVDHIDKSNQVDFLHPYQNGLIYVKSAKYCYSPSTVMFIDKTGQSRELYASYYLAVNCQFYENLDGSISILLSGFNDYDVGFGGIIKVDFDGDNVEVSGAPSTRDFDFSLNFAFHFSNDTLFTISGNTARVFVDTTLKDMTIIEYKGDRGIYTYDPFLFGEANELFIVGYHPDYDIMVLDNLTSTMEGSQPIFRGNFVKVNDGHFGADKLFSIGAYNVATSRDTVSVYSSSFEESLFTIPSPGLDIDDYSTEYYVYDEELYVRFKIEASDESQIFKLNVFEQEWRFINNESRADGDLFFHIETETSEITVSNINENMNISIEKVPLQESIDFPKISARLIKGSYEEILSDNSNSNSVSRYEIKATILNEGSVPIDILNVDSDIRNRGFCQSNLQFDGVLESNQEIELIDTVYNFFGDPIQSMQLFISGANFKQVDSEPITADFITSTENVLINPLSIYPNPATHSITVDVDEIGGQLNYKLISLDGQIVSAGVIDKKQIDTTNLPDGLYMIQLRSNDTFHLGKFVKH